MRIGLVLDPADDVASDSAARASVFNHARQLDHASVGFDRIGEYGGYMLVSALSDVLLCRSAERGGGL